MKNRFVLGELFLMAVICWGVEALVPAFSGDWKLDPGASDLGPMAGAMPDTRLAIRMDGNSLTIKKTYITSLGESSTSFRFTTDGKECFNSGDHFKDLRGTAVLQDGTIVIRSEQEVSGMEGPPDSANVTFLKVDSVEEYSLSAGAKTLTIVQTVELPDGRLSLKLVFQRLGE